MQIYPILAQFVFTDTLNSGTATARSIAQGWDTQWLNLLQNNTSNNLYGALTNLGVFFAVGTLLFFVIQWFNDMIQSEYSRPLSALIWPFIVVVLLSNSGNGSLLSTLTLGFRGFINSVNQQVVTTADADQVYQQALNMSVAEEVVGSLLRPCQALTGGQQNQCFRKANERIDTLLKEYKKLYDDQPWIQRLETQVNSIINPELIVSENSFNSLIGNTVQTSIKNFLVSLQYAFQNLIEATMLLIAVLGPVAVGGSLLPVAGKPIFLWLTGFISAGIAKLSFNIIAIITAAVIVNGPAKDLNANPDLMWFMIFLGVLAPLLSLVLAGLGGLGVFNGISNAATMVRDRI